MALLTITTAGLRPLPFRLLSQSIPMLSRGELEDVIERLIDELDQRDGDPDVEDDDPAGQMDEDGVNTGSGDFYLHGVKYAGAGCPLNDLDERSY